MKKSCQSVDQVRNYMNASVHRITYQEDNRNVQHESDHGVGQESKQSNVVDVAHGHLGDFEEESSDTVHNSADRSKVVEGDKRVHLELSGAQQALNHDQSNSLEDDTTDLEQETNEDELDFTKGSNDDTDDNSRDVHKHLQVDRRHSQSPGSEQDSDGSSGFEHLDKSDAEVQVGDITADQTQTEEETDGDDSTEVDATSHLDGLAAIKQCSGAGEDLGHEGCEGQMPCCQENR